MKNAISIEEQVGSVTITHEFAPGSDNASGMSVGKGLHNLVRKAGVALVRGLHPNYVPFKGVYTARSGEAYVVNSQVDGTVEAGLSLVADGSKEREDIAVELLKTDKIVRIAMTYGSPA